MDKIHINTPPHTHIHITFKHKCQGLEASKLKKKKIIFFSLIHYNLGMTLKYTLFFHTLVDKELSSEKKLGLCLMY